MDDIAGCRLIFNSVDELYAFREKVHAASTHFSSWVSHDSRLG